MLNFGALLAIFEKYGEDMLFPDVSRRLFASSGQWTATEDCFIVGNNYVSLSDESPASLYINNVYIPVSAGDNSHFTMYVAKGDTIRYGGNWYAYGLKKSS